MKDGIRQMMSEETERATIRNLKKIHDPMLCRPCNEGNHSGHNGDECRNDNAFNSACQCLAVAGLLADLRGEQTAS